MAKPVKTYGLTHIALAVRNIQRALRFYQKVFGVVEVYRRKGFLHAQTPGTRDVLVFQERAAKAGKTGGVLHYGFRLTTPKDIDKATRAVKHAGGKIVNQGTWVPGEPYLFAKDPDGNEFEIWYELPTLIDPPTQRKKKRKTKR